jgi:hypothetical protein
LYANPDDPEKHQFIAIGRYARAGRSTPPYCGKQSEWRNEKQPASPVLPVLDFYLSALLLRLVSPHFPNVGTSISVSIFMMAGFQRSEIVALNRDVVEPLRQRLIITLTRSKIERNVAFHFGQPDTDPFSPSIIDLASLGSAASPSYD